MTAAHTPDDDHGETDPLTAAILDEPMPGSAHSDTERMEEYRAARADLATLRQQLALIADALTAQEPARLPARTEAASPRPPGRRTDAAHPGRPKPPRQARRGRIVAAGGLAAALVLCAVSGLTWLRYAGGGGTSVGLGDAKAAPGGYAACARLVVEGTVTRVVPEPGTEQDRFELAVTHHYKPATGPARITFLMDHDVLPPLRTGDHTLIVIPGQASGPDLWSTGEKQIAHDRAWILAELNASPPLTCDEKPSDD
ncbi:hypothetical protein [Streptomyces sp. BE230]|uniref:hypothetical protein n=1 Tax=Streptomyces sp. BE230 TaxID=3002526 RepID=UPI002ED4D325|nr:hypothetical protein [Streptomyces sp. BE230]